MSESSPLAIVGISCLFPKADGLQSYWRNIKNGVDAITPIPERSHWGTADYFDSNPKSPDRTYAKRGGFLSPIDFNPMEFGIAPKDVEATDTTQLLGMVAAKQALQDAGYDTKPFNRQRTSVILGVTGALELVIPLGARLGHPIWRRALKESGVAEPIAEEVVQRISDAYVGWQENSFPGLLGNVAAGRIASRLDLGGTNCVVDAACASSLAALHLAILELRTGRSDMVITGGLDTFNDIFMYMCFSKTPALSPSGDAKPFDRGCDGTIIGEGLGMLVMKRLEDAQRDQDHIYAVIKGLGSSSDGKGNAIYAPRPEGQKQALQRAYTEAGVAPDTIGLVEAHGTGTKVGDATEIQALTEVFRGSGREGTWAALGSVKSQIGHTKAAAGVAGLIKAALALERKVLPPTIKVTQPIEGLAPNQSPFYVNTQKRPWLPEEAHPRRAGVSAFGFGGTNFHCVLEEYNSAKDKPDWDGDVEILALCGATRQELHDQLSSLPDAEPWAETRARAQRSRQEFRAEAQFRILWPITPGTTLGVLRDAALGMLEKNPDKAGWFLPSGVAFGSGVRRGKLGALFPGQGSQYVGMLRDLACQFPGMIEALTKADRVFALEQPERGLQRLSDFIYPPPAFSEEGRRQQEEALKSTEVAQPALGAMGLGALSVLSYFGVEPEAAGGHSYGELLALCGAGRLESDSLHHLSNLRGRLMANRNGHSDRGAMLAVQASEEAVASVLREERLSLVIANRNSPSQFVLAGSKAQIQQAEAELKKRSVRARVLPVSAAFHSPLVADAQEPFAAALKKIRFNEGHLPVYANTTAKAYPETSEEARELLAGQIVHPVDFLAQIQNMFADGVTTFLEMGPGHVLSDLVQAILPGKEIDAIALDASKGTRSGTFDLSIALCRLAALGHKVDLTRWEGASPMRPSEFSGKASLTIPLSGANYRTPQPHTPASSSARVVPGPAKSAAPATTASSPQRTATPVRSAEPAPQTPNSAFLTSQPGLAAALDVAQKGILSLQKLQEQTAQLHRQFLENQDAARRTLESLLSQRRELLNLPPITSAPVAPASPQPWTSGPNPLPTAPAAPAPVLDPRVQPLGIALAPAKPPHQASDAIGQIVLEVVAEKTGYPAEMLNLEMGLDSDLGVDSIKRVEIMASLRGRLPGAPEIKPEHLGTLQTLQQVVGFLAGGSQTNPAPSSAAASPLERKRVSEILLEVVSEKTGYPVEMLNLDMGLDSDLGVDSIKRVEIMATMRTKLPEAPEIKPEHLGTLRTLDEVVAFLTEKPAAKAGSTATQVQFSPQAPGLDGARVCEVLLGVVADKTGYPVEMLSLDMGLDSDLGVDSIKRVEIMAAMRTQLPEAPEIKPEHLGTLQTLRQIAEFLSAGSKRQPAIQPVSPKAEVNRVDAPPVPAMSLNRQVVKPVELGKDDRREQISLPSAAEIWVTDDGSSLSEAVEKRLRERGYSVRRSPVAELIAAQPNLALSGLVILWPAKRGNDAVLKEAFRLIQAAGPGLRREQGGGRTGILVTVSRLDGVFGFGSLNGNGDPTSGGLAGLVKTAGLEWPEVNCKAIDLNSEAEIGPEAADFIVEEMFRVGPAEVGLSGDRRFCLEVQEVPFASSGAEPVLRRGDVVVVTGGARGITAAAALQLARRHQPKLVLLGRSPLPEAEPEWLTGITGEAEIKKAILGHSRQNRSPKHLETKYREIMAQREIREHLRRIRATGATASYYTLDVRHPAEVRKALEQVRRELGPIRGLVHGAGVLADRKIEDKTEEQFDLVYGTKVSGLRNLLAASAEDDLRLLALFSSYSGRFGRKGQVDYAAANEVLNKIAQSESRRRPGCRVVSFNWGPWNGGMVSGSLRGLFEQEGVGLIEPEVGANFFVREISSYADHSVEVLALAPVSTPSRNGGAESRTHEPKEESVAFEREVSVKALPCLESHVLNGNAVLPAALMIEWLAHGAVHDNPGMLFHGLEKFQVLKGVILEPDTSTTAYVVTETGQMRDGLLWVPAQLWTRSKNQKLLHARADVLLTEVMPKPATGYVPLTDHANGNGKPIVYGQGELFHGAHFQGIEAIEICSPTEVSALVKSAPAPKKWIRNPLRPTWMSDPLALDSSFQLMILWSEQYRGGASLPCAIQRFRQYTAGFPKAGSRVVIHIDSASGPILTAHFHFFDREGGLLAVAEGYECVVDAGLQTAFHRNQLEHEA